MNRINGWKKASGSTLFLVLAATLIITTTTGFMAGCVAAEEEPPIVDNNRKRVFVSSQVMTGNLGGRAGADSLCGVWAGAASLGGTWKAFLSTSGTGAATAASRIDEVGPWYNVGRQTLIFNNKTGFTVGAIAAIPTEYNTAASGKAWTGTLANGTANGNQNCSNWTSNAASVYASVGTPSADLDAGAAWMAAEGNIPSCATTARVYCFEQ